MITAKKMREISEEGRSRVIAAQRREVLANIRRAAERGHFYAYVKRPAPEVVDELKAAGFMTEAYGDYLDINW